ncbi:hypothetical protein J4462_05140 [Candidatus Pacearchaeota archaeon]|nr:hypothetical protein [Candidatus Pacearchaeota archaeon]
MENRIISVNTVVCHGRNGSGGAALLPENRIEVIIHIYDDGLSTPLCPHYQKKEGDDKPRCYANKNDPGDCYLSAEPRD